MLEYINHLPCHSHNKSEH